MNAKEFFKSPLGAIVKEEIKKGYFQDGSEITDEEIDNATVDRARIVITKKENPEMKVVLKSEWKP